MHLTLGQQHTLEQQHSITWNGAEGDAAYLGLIRSRRAQRDDEVANPARRVDTEVGYFGQTSSMGSKQVHMKQQVHTHSILVSQLLSITQGRHQDAY